MPSFVMSRFSRGAAVCSVAASTLLSATAADAMARYLYRKRPIIVFAPSDSHPSLAQQKNLLNNSRTGLSDRDVVVVYVIGGGVAAELGPVPTMSGAALRSRYRVSEGQFRVMLIGKDGFVKRDSTTVIPPTEFFAEIDRMPMRREEVKRRSDN